MQNSDRTQQRITNSEFQLLAGESEVRELMRARDWSATPLGVPDRWPQSLRAVVRVMLTSRFAMWMAWGPELTFLCNDAYLPTVGIKRDWVIGSRSDEVWAEIWPDIGPRIERVLATGEATWDEALLLYLERSGYPEETYHTFSYSPLADDAGNISGMLCVVAEVTKEVISARQLATLRDLGARLAGASTRTEVMTAFDACLSAEPPDLPFALTYLADSSGHEAALASVHGLDRALTATWAAGMAEAVAGRLSQVSDSKALTIDVPSEIARQLPRGRGQISPQRALLVPMRSSENGVSVGHLVIGLNPHRTVDGDYQGFIELMTAQVAAAIARADEYERERQRAEALAELDRAKTAFFSNVSHEFRTPLTLMLGPLEDALAELPDVRPRERQRLEVAHRNALRLLRLVNALLDFSRIEAGRMKASYRATDLAALTADLASSFRSATDRARLDLIVHTPSLSQPAYVDRDMWEKIVLNLISNAFKFTFEGEIEVSLQEVGDTARLAVRDTGMGIPAHEIPNLFNRFHRVEGVQGRSFEGSGIGLALVKELVDLHGGSIDVDSELGRGSTFAVTVPLGVAHLKSHLVTSEEETSTSSRARSFVEEALRWLPGQEPSLDLFSEDEPLPIESGLHGERRRVLVADDNTDLRGYIARLLAGRGYEVAVAADGREAVLLAKTEKPDLIITDVMMPNVDGFGLLQAVRGDPSLRELPVIMLSARAGEEAKIEGLEAGADDYLIKPFSARELLARVAAHIAMARLRREAGEAVRASDAKAQAQAERVQLALDAGAIVGTWVWNVPEDQFIADERFARAFALDTDSARTGLPLHVVAQSIFEPDRQRVLDAVGAALQKGGPYQCEYRIRQPDGSYRWIEANGRVDLAPDGSALRFPGVLIDIDHRRRMEEELRSLNETLETRVTQAVQERETAQDALRQSQKMEAMGQLTGGVAHDFNNLLTPIIATLDMLQRRRIGGDREQRLIDGALQASERAKLLVQRLLAFARRQPLQTVNVDIAKLISEMSQLVASTTGPQISVVVECPEHLPPARADPNQLEMALLNLSVNARDAMPDGGTLRISARMERIEKAQDNLKPGAYICLSVADTGTGMDAATLTRAIEPFFSTKGIGKGTGLGLSMVHGLLSQLDGALVIRSRQGLGTNVEMWLPQSTGKAIPEEAPANTSVSGKTSGRALIVDDEEFVRLSTADMLTELGYSVVEAASAEQALRLIRQGERFDVVITDHLMPGMSGLDLARTIRFEHPTLPVLIMSGYSEAAGVDPDLPRLTKPFRSDELALHLAQLHDATHSTADLTSLRRNDR